MSVVLLEELIESFNKSNDTQLEVYSGVGKDVLVEIGVAERFENKPLINVRFKQSKGVPYNDGLDQGAAKIIDALFASGMNYLINYVEKKDEELKEGSGELCEDNL